MSRLIQFLNKFIHILFYITTTAVICGIFCQDNKFVNIIIIAIGLIGVCYIGYIIFILFSHRVKFDLHFVKDNFIYKIGFLVLSVPCIICSFVLLSTLFLKYKWSPKEMVFDENLYIESQVENIDTLKVIKFKLCSIFHKNKKRGAACLLQVFAASPDIDISFYQSFLTKIKWST